MSIFCKIYLWQLYLKTRLNNFVHWMAAHSRTHIQSSRINFTNSCYSLSIETNEACKIWPTLFNLESKPLRWQDTWPYREGGAVLWKSSAVTHSLQWVVAVCPLGFPCTALCVCLCVYVCVCVCVFVCVCVKVHSCAAGIKSAVDTLDCRIIGKAKQTPGRWEDFYW